MCMRPFAWGGMLLVGVVAFLGITTVRTVRRDNLVRMTAVEARTDKRPEVVIWTDARATNSRASSDRKPKPTRIVDPDQIVYGPVMVVGDFCETKDQAYDSAIEAVRGRLLHDLHLVDLPSSEWVRERLSEHRLPEERQGVIGDEPAHRMKLQVEMKLGTYLELAEADRAFRVRERIDWVAHGIGIAVVALGALAGYIRLDELTKGYYTGRLRLLAVVLVVAASFAISRV